VAGLTGAGRFLFPQVMLIAFLSSAPSAFSDCPGSSYVEELPLFVLAPLMIGFWTVSGVLGFAVLRKVS
jgi:hypothetical protein